MDEKCKSCIRKLEYKTSYPCRYCTDNSERASYLGFRPDIEVKSYYYEVPIANDEDASDIPY